MTTDLTDPRGRTDLAARLARRRPAETDALLRSSASSLGVRLNVRLAGRYPTGPNGESLGSYTVAVGCEVTGSLGQLHNVAHAIEAALTPAPVEAVEAWLAELAVLVPRRGDDFATEAVRVEAYVSRLMAYPADVAREALLGRTWRFWPSWDELHRVCEELSTPRRHMLAACRAEPVQEVDRGSRKVGASPEEAKAILDRAGFTTRRFQAVQERPMATTREELLAEKDRQKVPHWSEQPGTAMHRLASAARERAMLAGEYGPEAQGAALARQPPQPPPEGWREGGHPRRGPGDGACPGLHDVDGAGRA